MKSNLDILKSEVSRKIYNLCLKESLTKKEISFRLYSRWTPNAVLPSIEELQKARYIDFIKTGWSDQRQRGKYRSTMLPVLQFMKTRVDWSEEEKEFLESESLKKEFFRINKDLRLEDDWLRPFRTFLEDILLHRLVRVPQVDEKFLTTFVEICKQVIADSDRKLSKDIESHRLLQNDVEDGTILHKSAQDDIKLHDSVQSHTKLYNSAQNGTKLNDIEQNQSIVIKSYQYDRIVEKSIEIFGEQYETITNSRNLNRSLENTNKLQDSLKNAENGASMNTNDHQQTSKNVEEPKVSYLKTDYLCLSLLIPERLCSRIKFSSPRGEMFSYLEGIMIR